MKFLALNYGESFDEPYVELNVTSWSTDWGKVLSPFLLGPVLTQNGFAQNVENAYQYSKVYDYHWDYNLQQPTEKYWDWREKGFKSFQAHRYPLGKHNSKRVVGLWIGKKGEPGKLLSYIEGRKQLYIPTYLSALRASRFYPTFLKFVADAYHSDTNLVFREFDVFNHHKAKKTLLQILNDPNYKYGHGFLLVEEAERFIHSHEEDFSNFELKLDSSATNLIGASASQIASQTSSLVEVELVLNDTTIRESDHNPMFPFCLKYNGEDMFVGHRTVKDSGESLEEVLGRFDMNQIKSFKVL